jgi:hypothetical protein
MYDLINLFKTKETLELPSSLDGGFIRATK